MDFLAGNQLYDWHCHRIGCIVIIINNTNNNKNLDESVCRGQPQQAAMTEGVAAEQEAGDLVAVETKHVLADTTFENL